MEAVCLFQMLKFTTAVAGFKWSYCSRGRCLDSTATTEEFGSTSVLFVSVFPFCKHRISQNVQFSEDTASTETPASGVAEKTPAFSSDAEDSFKPPVKARTVGKSDASPIFTCLLPDPRRSRKSANMNFSLFREV